MISIRNRFLPVLLPALALACVVSHSASAAPTTAPAGMKWIPGGEFLMGNPDPDATPDERPAHRVRVDGFWMDEHHVTNAQFRKFVEATGYKTVAERPINWEELKKQLPAGTPKPPAEMLQPGSLVFTPPGHDVDLRNMANWWTWTTGANWQHPGGPQTDLSGKEDYPVVHVAWEDAVAYAKWAGKRLPTEAEWEYASKGGKEGQRYPWGNEFKPDGRFMANTYTGHFPVTDTAEDGYAGVSPVRCYPPNGYGLYDMAGNVWQWTADLYRVDALALGAQKAKESPTGCCLNPKGPADTFNPTRDMPESPERVIKGGSFLCHVSYCESYRPAARRGTPLDTGSQHVGFRCVKDADAPTTATAVAAR